MAPIKPSSSTQGIKVITGLLAIVAGITMAPMASAQQQQPPSSDGNTQTQCETRQIFVGDLPVEVEDCPDQTGSSTAYQSFNFVSNLLTRISEQRKLNRRKDRLTIASDGIVLGGAASADSGAGGIADSGRFSPFFMADTSEVERDKTEAGKGYDQGTDSAVLGFDYRFGRSLFVGATLNYSASDTDFDNRKNFTEVDSYILGVHASKYWENNVFVDGLLTYGRIELDKERVDPNDYRYNANADGDMHSAELAVGRDFSVQRWRITPRARLLHLRGELDKYTEEVSGAPMAFPPPSPQTIESQPFDFLDLELSLQADYVILFDWGVLVPSINLAYHHEYTGADVTRGTVPGAFGGPSTSFAQQTDDPDQNTEVARVGISAQFRHGLSGFVSYEELFEHEYMDRYNAVIGVRYELP